MKSLMKTLSALSDKDPEKEIDYDGKLVVLDYTYGNFRKNVVPEFKKFVEENNGKEFIARRRVKTDKEDIIVAPYELEDVDYWTFFGFDLKLAKKSK